jgi:regulator of nucleoside diphosphate kinase
MKSLLVKKEDFDIITTYIRNGSGRPSFDRHNVTELEAELQKATLVSSKDFPSTVVGLNSTAIIKDLETRKVLTITVVTPDKANIQQNKVSVLAPIGIALLGFGKGAIVHWQVPSGQKQFMIMDVVL